MNTKIIFFSMVLALCCASCAQIGGIGNVLTPATPEETLFENAEEAFRNGAYPEALGLYTQYLTRYPGSNLGPEAMMKIGLIHIEQGAFEKARNAFSELIRQFPGTDFARKAEVETLYAYFEEGRFQQVIDYAGRLSKDRLPPDLQTRSRLVVGDAYMALGAYPEAYLVFLEGFEKSPRGRQKLFEDRLMSAVAYLDPEFIKEALSRLNGKPPSGLLLYQLGVNSMAKGQVGEADAAFTEFVERYPRHPFAEAARQRIDQIRSETDFEGNRVGCLLPLTGPYEKIGNRALQAIQLALSEFGGRGINPPLEMIVRDTGGDPDQARRGVEELSASGVSAIIGPIMTAVAAGQTAQQIGLPMITLTQKPGVVEIGDFVFRNFMTPEMQMDTLVDYTTGVLGITRFAVLYPDEPYGRTYLDLFREKIRKRNGTIVVLEQYSPKSNDFSDVAKRLSMRKMRGATQGITVGDGMRRPASNFEFEAVFIPDSPDKVGLIIPQMRFHDIKNVYFLGTNLWHSHVLIKYAGGHLQQAIIPDGFHAGSTDPHVRHFVEQFNAVFGRQPEYIEAASYDSAMILFDLIARPDINSRGALKEALRNMLPYDGVTGRTEFSETGEAEKSLYLLGVDGDQFVEIDRAVMP